jgi:A1 cistron-splicing factor AAR2
MSMASGPQQQGRQSNSHDAILVISDAPKSMEFGVDCMSYETGNKFCGMSMIPPGLHFYYHGTGMGARYRIR